MPDRPHPTQSGSEPELGRLHSQVKEARAKIEAAAYGRSWACPHCGSERSHGDDWWRPDDLLEAAGVDGTVAMIALHDLVNAGALAMNSRLRVRRTR